jgi:hypothetical protein
MLSNCHDHSQGPWWGDYYWEGAPNLQAKYENATVIAAKLASCSTTPISTSLPTVTSLAASASLNRVTLDATHLDGIQSVNVYRGSTFNLLDPEPSHLGAAVMTWNGWPGGVGSYTTNYDTTKQACVFDTLSTGAALDVASSEWFAVLTTSCKGDYRWDTVQAT